MTTFRCLLPALFLLLLTAAARAQVGPSLTLDPWTPNVHGETRDQFILVDRGRVRGADTDTHIFTWDSYGRLRANPADPRSLALGYRLLTIDTGIHDTRILPTSDLNVYAVAGAFPLGAFGSTEFTFIAGGGYYGNSPFNDSDAAYGIGHFIANTKLNATDALALTLDYDGHSEFLPDVPLPGFAYTHVDPHLRYTLGYPRTAVQWLPAERWVLEARYSVPYSVYTRASYEFFKNFQLYASYTNFFEAFQPSDAERTNRLFFEQRRAEVGVRVLYRDLLDLSVGIGYAFDQELTRGFDIRDRTTSAELFDRPYVAIVLRGTF